MARLLTPSLRSCFIFRHEFTCGHWPPMRFPVLSRLIDSRLHPVPQNIPFEFGVMRFSALRIIRKHGQHACESAAARGGEIECFAQRNEAHVERRQPSKSCRRRLQKIRSTLVAGGECSSRPRWRGGVRRLSSRCGCRTRRGPSNLSVQSRARSPSGAGCSRFGWSPVRLAADASVWR